MKIKSANPAPIRNTACETPGIPGNLKTKTQKRDACCVRNFFTGGLLRAAQILVVNTVREWKLACPKIQLGLGLTVAHRSMPPGSPRQKPLEANANLSQLGQSYRYAIDFTSEI
jgi:hypothetical protein